MDSFEELGNRFDRSWEEAEDENEVLFNKTVRWEYCDVKPLPEHITTALIGVRGCGAVLLRSAFPFSTLCGTIVRYHVPQASDNSDESLTHEAREKALNSVPQEVESLSSSDCNAECCSVFACGTALIVVNQFTFKSAYEVSSFTDFLLGVIKASAETRIFCFGTLLRTKYPRPFDERIVRMLCTATAAEKTEEQFCPSLEIPAIVDGPLAALLSLCEFKKIPCNCFLSLEETHFLEAESIMAHKPILDKICKQILVGDEEMQNVKSLSLSSVQSELKKLAWRTPISLYV